MQDVTITISKSLVWHEVAKATNYTGAKMVTQEDSGAYDRISTIDEDREMMERFWVEACSLVTSQLKEWVKTVEDQPIHHGVDVTSDYEVTLSVADAWPTALLDSVQSSLLSFVVATILSKWYRLTNKGEVEAYSNEAAAHLVDAQIKLYQRVRPTRP
jgi:hypothetical protein